MYRGSKEAALFFSKPQSSNDGGNISDGKAAFFLRSQRQRINIYPAFQALFVPWILFCVVYAVMTSSIHFAHPWLCYLLVACGLVVVVVCGGFAIHTTLGKVLQSSEIHEPNWCIFLFLTMLTAWTLGVVLGNLNFWTNFQPYYDLTNLNEYSGVDPGRMRGQELMDTGRAYFVNNTALDLRRSMGFRNQDTYCVAPITLKGAGTLLPLADYDFWAVGLGCCSGHTADFHCGEFENPSVHSGLRMMQDEHRPFFRLAVQQAEAAYGIRATHPLFFYWTKDATAEMNAFRDEGYKYYLIGMIVHLVWQLLTVGLAILAFKKLGYY